MVFVSEKAAAYIDGCENSTAEILTPDHIKSVITSHIENSKIPVTALIFIEIDEYDELNSPLAIHPETDLIYQFVLFGPDSELNISRFSQMTTISEFRSDKLTINSFNFIVEKSISIMNVLSEERTLQKKLMSRLIDTRQDQEDLIDIGRALSSEKDPDKLLRLILFLSKRITGADAGSIYLVENGENGEKRLRFKYSHTFSRDIPLEEFTIEMNKKSIAGYVAVTGAVLNIPDVYHMPENTPYTYNNTFDIQNNYLCRSMLVVPMKNNSGNIIGVIQLINCKEDHEARPDIEDEAFSLKLENHEDFDKYVRTFDKKYDSLLEAVAGQAAAAIENNRLIKQIQEQFEEFVKASVIAIESRDPATSGHSFRVSEICRELALAVNDVNEGPLAEYNFSENDLKELELAALLHDFGKVYIDLSVFTKAKKLYPKDFDNLSLRLNYLYRFIELDYTNKETEALKNMPLNDETDRFVNSLVAEKNMILDEIKGIKKLIASLNEPAVTDKDPEVIVQRIHDKVKHINCITIDGDPLNIMTETDRLNLSIKKGSLNPEERKEIETHVVHTYNFVSKIPWPPEYSRIPEIALRHHEKLNGTGYPDRLKGRENIPIQARIMAIADVYDALAATDRPYKKAVPLPKTLKILQQEAEQEVLDPDLVDLFIRNCIYEKISLSLPSHA